MSHCFLTRPSALSGCSRLGTQALFGEMLGDAEVLGLRPGRLWVISHKSMGSTGVSAQEDGSTEREGRVCRLAVTDTAFTLRGTRSRPPALLVWNLKGI